MFEKIIAVATIGQAAYTKWRLHRLVSTAIAAISLIIVTSLMIGALIIGGCYASYLFLLNVGYGPMQAMLLVGLVMIIITVSLFAATVTYIRKLRQNHSPIPERQTVMDAFLEGLLEG